MIFQIWAGKQHMTIYYNRRVLGAKIESCRWQPQACSLDFTSFPHLLILPSSYKTCDKSREFVDKLQIEENVYADNKDPRLPSPKQTHQCPHCPRQNRTITSAQEAPFTCSQSHLPLPCPQIATILTCSAKWLLQSSHNLCSLPLIGRGEGLSLFSRWWQDTWFLARCSEPGLWLHKPHLY